GKRERLVEPRHMRREGRQHNAAGSSPKDSLQPLTGHALRKRPSLSLRVGGIDERDIHARRRRFRDSFEVGAFSIRRIRVQLEVAEMKKTPAAGLEEDARRIRNGMRDSEEADGERARRVPLAWTHFDQAFSRPIRLFEPAPRETEREGKSIDRGAAPL